MPDISTRHYSAVGEPLKALFVLAHGAGAGHTHPFMEGYAGALASSGVDVVTFNFPYVDAKRRAPDRPTILEACFASVVVRSRAMRGLEGHALFIGGKSMGGRMATHLAAQRLDGLRGVIALGYPLHPPGKPDQLRVAHLTRITVPVLIVQGERDVFGTPVELRPYSDDIPGGATVRVVPEGDHSLNVKGVKPDQTRAELVTVIVEWMRRRCGLP